MNLTSQLITELYQSYEYEILNNTRGYPEDFIYWLRTECPENAYRSRTFDANRSALIRFFCKYFANQEIRSADVIKIVDTFISEAYNQYHAAAQQMNNSQRIIQRNDDRNVLYRPDPTGGRVRPAYQRSASPSYGYRDNTTIGGGNPPNMVVGEEPMYNNNVPQRQPEPVQVVEPIPEPQRQVIHRITPDELNRLNYSKLYSEKLDSSFFEGVDDKIKENITGYVIPDIKVNGNKTVILISKDNESFDHAHVKAQSLLKDKILPFTKLKDYNYIFLHQSSKYSVADVPTRVMSKLLKDVQDEWAKRAEVYTSKDANGNIKIDEPERYDLRRIESFNEKIMESDIKYRDTLNAYFGQLINSCILTKFSGTSEKPNNVVEVESLKDYYDGSIENYDLGAKENNRKAWVVLNALVIKLLSSILYGEHVLSSETSNKKDVLECGQLKEFVKPNFDKLIDPKIMESEVSRLFNTVSILRIPHRIMMTNLFTQSDMEAFTKNYTTEFGYMNLFNKKDDKILVMLNAQSLANYKKSPDTMYLIDDKRSDTYIKEFNLIYPVDLLLMPIDNTMQYIIFKDNYSCSPLWRKCQL